MIHLRKSQKQKKCDWKPWGQFQSPFFWLIIIGL
jgi:hypothetical protein